MKEEPDNRLVFSEELLNESYWNDRWMEKQTGWDIGYAAPAIMDYATTIQNKDGTILIPGCGNAYEVEGLLKLGFKNITVIDIAPKLVAQLREKFKLMKTVKVIEGDFFQHKGSYDFIIEQTFFCAIPPSRREEYVIKMSELLNGNGQLFGLLFNRVFFQNSPPFGGSMEEYQTIFNSQFTETMFEKCENSIPPRAGTELFFIGKR